MSKRKYFKAGDAVFHRGRQEWGFFIEYGLGQYKAWVDFQDDADGKGATRVSTKQLSFEHRDAETDQQD